MKKIFVILSLLTLPHLAMGALSPAVYERAKSHASDVVLIKTGRVIRYRLARNRVLVKARARVLHTYRSSSRRRVQWITIRYITRLHKRSHNLLGGPVAIPVLSPGRTYKAYLKRIRNGYYYTPAASYQSFIPQNKHRRRHVPRRKRLL